MALDEIVCAMGNAAGSRRLMGAWLALAGCNDGGRGAEAQGTTSGVESESTTAASTSTSTTSTTGVIDGTGAVSSDDTSGTSRGSTSSGSTSTGSTTTDSQTDGSTTESIMAMPCAESCAVQFACTKDWRTEQACVDACEANLMKAEAFEVACAAAWEDLYTCLGTLTCEELAEWMNPSQVPYPCMSEDEVLGFECAGQ